MPIPGLSDWASVRLTWPDQPHVGQISPDKNVNFRYTTAAFTLSPESRALLCRANSPGDWALYAVSVRRLIALHSDFLRTFPRGSALVFGSYLCQCIFTLTGFTYRGLAPHKFTPMPGVHKRIHPTRPAIGFYGAYGYRESKSVPA